MKLLTAILFSLAALTAAAVEIGVTPLKFNGVKNLNGKEIVTGTVAPGAFVDFPLEEKSLKLRANRAFLVPKRSETGIILEPSDYRLKLLGKDLKQYDYFGAPGKNGEIVFALTNAPEEISLIRLYIDIDRKYTGKTVVLSFSKFTFEEIDKPDAFIPLRGSQLVNCRQPSLQAPVFSGIPENGGSSVVFNLPPELKNFAFTEVEIGISMQKGKLDAADLKCNPRTERSSVMIEDPVIDGSRFTFYPDKAVNGSSWIFLYFNKVGKHTGKELSFTIDYIRLVP